MAKRLVYNAAYNAAIEAVCLREPDKNDVFVQTLNSGISRGTEALVYSGQIPETEHDRMRCPNQNGCFAFPINYGYACTGKVIAVGENVDLCKADDPVFVLHPHQSRFVVNQQWVFPLPNFVTLERGVLAANLETALNAYWDADVQGDEECAIIGAGVVGLLTAYIVSCSNRSKVTIIDTNSQKQQISEHLGLCFRTPDQLDKREFACIFNTSASSQGLQTAIDHAAFEGRVIEMSWYGKNPVNLCLGGAFHSRRLSVISSQVGHVASRLRNTLTHRQRMARAMKYLVDPRLDALLTPRLEFGELPEKLPDIFEKNSGALCPLINHLPDRL